MIKNILNKGYFYSGLIQLPMDNSFLIIEDLDDLILPYVDPPTVLALTQVNKHYNHILKDKQTQFNLIKFDAEIACKTPNALWILKWLLDLDHKLSQIPYSKHILIPKILPNLAYGFVLACQNGFEEMVKYIVEFMATTSHRELDTSDGFAKSIESGHLTVATYLLNIADNKRILIVDGNSFLKTAFLNNDLPMAKWIVSTCEELGIVVDIHENEDELFTIACEQNNISFVEWLIDLGESDSHERFELSYHGTTALEFEWEISIDILKVIIKSSERDGYNRIDIHQNNEHMFKIACYKGSISHAELLIQMGEEKYGKIDIHNNNEEAFWRACKRGHISMAQWLIDLGEKSHGKIDIHVRNERPFRYACLYGHTSIAKWLNGHTSIAKWLIDLGEKSYGKIDIHAKDEEVFRTACANSLTDLAKLLIDMGEESYGKIDIHANDEEAFRTAFEIMDDLTIEWLIKIGEESYGQINIHANNEEAMRRACLHGKPNHVQNLIEMSKKSYGKIAIDKVDYYAFTPMNFDEYDEKKFWYDLNMVLINQMLAKLRVDY